MLFSWFSQTYFATECGHWTKKTGKVTAFGRRTTTKMPLNESGSVDYCLDCISKMAIQCTWCGGAILIGDNITLYSIKGEFQAPDYAVSYGKEVPQYVGCMNQECADTWADCYGRWLPGEDGKGAPVRTPTAYEMIEAAESNACVTIVNSVTKLIILPDVVKN